ncbi:MAG: energy transducer TonB [Balneolaceae bacterium]|nr:energy transducer TonB [Balneolaceae bacterium]MBO6545578.1 energy transducer TonB [Balneolaceae bacterium]MBO6646974.1 energy transducer TonB [Balneolaceae bacterium]
MKIYFLQFLLIVFFLTNCVTTQEAFDIEGHVFNLDNGTTVIVGFLNTDEAMYPGNFEGEPNSEFARYPEMAQRAGIEGTVVAYLNINEEGELLESRITRGIGGGCDEAALQIVRNSIYTPAKNQNADPVSARHYVSVTFML